MLIYRFLTGEDDGGPTYAFDAHNKKMRAGQAVTRPAKDQPYDPDKKLSEY